ncbi:MAG TPA: hypothetical protein DEP18_09375 [Flavobacteriales bacterium]|nr:hypothetical protein [Flavobacteriales bacterium]HRE75659.1 hypothetical protein [Flavobacteriales bacterium]HRE96673.1 hypothetical protein [Flavobacteriales bacterium]HRJ39839.1 hypothetical protein [Flavobacteriales bacterium]
MNTSLLYSLIKNDLKMIFRDKTMIVFMIAPLFLWLFIRFPAPYLFSQSLLLDELKAYILMFGAMQTSILTGFVSSFLILEEKDENIFSGINVLPVPLHWFLIIRVTFFTMLAGIFSFIILRFNGWMNLETSEALLLGFEYSLIAPFIVMVITTFAANKVEGIAYFKAIDLLLILPMLSFLVKSQLMWLAGIIPTFWLFRQTDAVIHQENPYFFFLALLISLGLIFSFLTRRFIAKTFNS